MLKHYYLEHAIDSRTGQERLVMVCAAGHSDALKKYNECIQRHPELVTCPGPHFCVLIGTDDFIRDQFTEEMIKELEREDSVAI